MNFKVVISVAALGALAIFNSGAPAGAAVTASGSIYDSGGEYHVGETSTGTLTVDVGSTFKRSYIYMGYNSNVTGNVTVRDPGSLLTVDDIFFIGAGGIGALAISNGGQVHDWRGVIGQDGSGSATVTGVGSTWTSDNDLEVGYHGSGTLTVNSGAVVTAETIYASMSSLKGTGAINVHGAVLDGTVTWDNPAVTTLTQSFGSGGTLTITNDGSGDWGAGWKGTGALTISNGVNLTSFVGSLGETPGAIGTATVTGNGSKWTVSNLAVGTDGSGILNIQNGGHVDATYCNVGWNWTSWNTVPCGIVSVSGSGSNFTTTTTLWIPPVVLGQTNPASTLTVSSGGTVNAQTLAAAWASLKGDGTIYAHGVILDGNLTFDATHGPSQNFTFGSGGTLALTLDGTGDLGVGFSGAGTLRVAEGQSVSSVHGYLTWESGSSATATVTGPGSTWNCAYLNIFESGVLTIENGGRVNSTDAYLGQSDLTAYAAVTGAGSKWVNSDEIVAGVTDVVTMLVADHGQMVTRKLTTGSGSTCAIRVSNDGMLVLGNATKAGYLSNGGTLNLCADAFIPAGTYTPITEYAGRTITWGGSSILQYGGIWSTTAHTLAVGTPVTVQAGETATVISRDRMLVVDGSGLKLMGASFGGMTGSKTISATPSTSAELSALAATSGFDGLVLSAWDLTTNITGNTVLSFNVGQGWPGLNLWKRTAGTWSAFAPTWQNLDSNGVEAFPVTSYTGYAVTASSDNLPAVTLNPGSMITLPAGGSHTLRTPGLTLAGATDAWTSKVDVNDNKLILDNANSAAATATYARVNNQLKQGFDNGAWDGQGIISTKAQTNVNNGIPVTIGVINNDDGSGNPAFFGDGTPATGELPQFGGQTVNGTAVLTKYTYFGDADLSGTVDAVDYSFFVAGVQSGGGLTGWEWGDFDYSGTIDAVDYSFFVFGVQGQAPGAPLAASASSPGSVPEPGSLALLGVAGIVVLLRRGRKI